MRHSKGFRAGTRQILRKKPRQRGKLSISKILYQYKLGEKVVIDIEPSVHKGMPHPRFNGKIGTIIEKRGRAYVIEIRDGRKMKHIITRPEHIKPLNGFKNLVVKGNE